MVVCIQDVAKMNGSVVMETVYPRQTDVTVDMTVLMGQMNMTVV